MNTFLKYFVALLPTIIKGVSTIPAESGDKKKMVQDILQTAAEGVAAVSPEHAEAASLAAGLASNSIDGVYAILKATGKVANVKPASLVAVAASK